MIDHATTTLRVNDIVEVRGWPKYDGELGTIQVVDQYGGEPYYGVKLEGVSHMVWCRRSVLLLGLEETA